MPSTNLWLGSQTAFEAVAEARANAIARMGDSDSMPDLPPLLTVQGNVGIIDIRGSLVNGNAGFMAYFGVTGYGDVRDALVAAVQNAEVKAILLNIDSGGGAVAGVHETAQLIARVNKVKPVVSYTGGTQASAAMWLGVAARSSFIAETAIAGSVGILMIHAERSKQLEDDGIKVTVIRAGSEKAAATPYEPLTEKAKANLEAKAMAIYDVFIGFVAEQRGVPTATADKNYGQGREFVGKQAVDVGLIDALGSLEDAFMKASKLGEKVASNSPAGQRTPATTFVKAEASAGFTANIAQVLQVPVELAQLVGDNAANPEGTNMPTPLTQEQLIAMAAGVTLEPVATAPAATAPVVTEPAAETTPAVEPAAPMVAPAAAASEVQLFLEKQLKDLQAELLTAKFEAKTAADSLAQANASVASLAAIAKNSLKTMSIGLNSQTDHIETLSATDLVSEHTRVSEVFKSKFKVGGVAATSTVEDPKGKTLQVDPLFLSAVQSLA